MWWESRKHPNLYCEIQQTHIFFSILRYRRSGYLGLHSERVEFDSTVINNSAIYNPSLIFKETRNFLNKHHLKTAYAVVVFPDLSYKSGIKQRLLLLQIIVCVGKAGLLVHSLINKSLLDASSL